MATLNYLMPENLKNGFCDREQKKAKNPHAWKPSGQSRAIATGQIALECYCKHCNLREWTQLSRPDFERLQESWKELQ